MEMNGEQLIPAARARVWEALNDPEILKQCVPGCESIQKRGADTYDALMVARIGPVSAKFRGKLTLADIVPPTSYSISFDGQGGAAGFGKGTARVSLAEAPVAGHPGTRLSYAVQAHVGGKLAQIGSRLVDMAAKKIAEDFFVAFRTLLTAPLENGHDEHSSDPVPVDPDLPVVDNASAAFFAAGALVVGIVALITLL